MSLKRLLGGGTKSRGKAGGGGVTLSGDVWLDKTLEEFPKALAKKLIKKSTNRAAKLVLEKARELAPVDSGDLERSIKKRALPRKQQRAGRIGYRVGNKEGDFLGDQFYAAFVELGTSLRAPDPFLRDAARIVGESKLKSMIQKDLKELIREAKK